MGLVQSVFQFSNAQLAESVGVMFGSELDVDVATVEQIERGQAPPQLDMNTKQVFTHWWDPDLAAIALSKALELSEQDIDALDGPAQYRAVVRAWAHFHSAFDYFNLRARSWSLYRKVFQAAFGTSFHGRVRAGDAHAGDFHRRVNSLAVKYSGANPDNPDRGNRYPDTITLGVRGQNGDQTMDPEPHHAIWADALNRVQLTPDPLPADAPMDPAVAVWDYGSLPFVEPTDAVPFVPRRRGDWSCLHWMRWSAFADPAYHVYCYPPLRWYWRLLFGPIPGLRLPEGRLLAPVAASSILLPGASADGCVSLAEYLLRAGPKLLARQTRYNVILTNTGLSSRLAAAGEGSSLAAAVGASVAAAAEAEAEAHRKLAEDPGLRMAMKLGESVSAIPGPYTGAVGLAIGLGTSIAAFVADGSIPKGRADQDVFGDIVVAAGGMRDTPLVFRATPLDGQTSAGQQAMIRHIEGLNDLLSAAPLSVPDPAGLVAAGYRTKVLGSYLGTEPEPAAWVGAGPAPRAPEAVRARFEDPAVAPNWWRVAPTPRTVNLLPGLFSIGLVMGAMRFTPTAAPTTAPTAPPTTPAATAATAATAAATEAPADEAPADEAPEDGLATTEPATSAPAPFWTGRMMAGLGAAAVTLVVAVGATAAIVSHRPAPRPRRPAPREPRRPRDERDEDGWGREGR